MDTGMIALGVIGDAMAARASLELLRCENLNKQTNSTLG